MYEICSECEGKLVNSLTNHGRVWRCVNPACKVGEVDRNTPESKK